MLFFQNLPICFEIRRSETCFFSTRFLRFKANWAIREIALRWRDLHVLMVDVERVRFWNKRHSSRRARLTRSIGRAFHINTHRQFFSANLWIDFMVQRKVFYLFTVDKKTWKFKKSNDKYDIQSNSTVSYSKLFIWKEMAKSFLGLRTQRKLVYSRHCLFKKTRPALLTFYANSHKFKYNARNQFSILKQLHFRKIGNMILVGKNVDSFILIRTNVLGFGCCSFVSVWKETRKSTHNYIPNRRVY